MSWTQTTCMVIHPCSISVFSRFFKRRNGWRACIAIAIFRMKSVWFSFNAVWCRGLPVSKYGTKTFSNPVILLTPSLWKLNFTWIGAPLLYSWSTLEGIGAWKTSVSQFTDATIVRQKRYFQHPASLTLQVNSINLTWRTMRWPLVGFLIRDTQSKEVSVHADFLGWLETY